MRAEVKLEERVESCCRRQPELDRKWATLCAVAGVGPVSATTLLATVPELGTLSDGQCAHLLGVAPLNCDSGTWRGKRHIYGGRRSSPTRALHGRLGRFTRQPGASPVLPTAARRRETDQSGPGGRHA